MAYIKCPTCTTQNWETSKFCAECGKPLPAVVKPPPQTAKKSALRHKDVRWLVVIGAMWLTLMIALGLAGAFKSTYDPGDTAILAARQAVTNHAGPDAIIRSDYLKVEKIGDSIWRVSGSYVPKVGAVVNVVPFSAVIRIIKDDEKGAEWQVMSYTS